MTLDRHDDDRERRWWSPARSALPSGLGELRVTIHYRTVRRGVGCRARLGGAGRTPEWNCSCLLTERHETARPCSLPVAKSSGRYRKWSSAGSPWTPSPFSIESDWVDVHPSFTGRGYFDPQRQPVGLNDVAEDVEDAHAWVVIVDVDRKIQVAVRSCLGTDEDVHTPAASNPVTDRRAIQPLKDFDDVAPEHGATLDSEHTCGPEPGDRDMSWACP